MHRAPSLKDRDASLPGIQTAFVSSAAANKDKKGKNAQFKGSSSIVGNTINFTPLEMLRIESGGSQSFISPYAYLYLQSPLFSRA